MKKYILIALLALAVTVAGAQTSRRNIENAATEAVKHAVLTGIAPQDKDLEQLAANAETSIEMISKMPDDGDAVQHNACMKTIRAIVNYASQPAGEAHNDSMREGLLRAIDRSDNPDTRSQLLDMLADCARPADAPHLLMYLSDADMAPAAYRILVKMPGIDDYIQSVAREATPEDSLITRIARSRAGSLVAAPAVKAKPKAVVPFWTAKLDAETERLRTLPDAEADSILSSAPTVATLPRLLAIARRREGIKRDAVIARYTMLSTRLGLAGAARYLVLREADEASPGDDMRRKIIIELGATHTVQALAYIRRYYDIPRYADAVAVAVADIVANNPLVNGGKHLHNMLNAAKYALACHYDEQGATDAIDAVLAALANCRLDNGYEFSNLAPTSMGKNGFWKRLDTMADFDLTFDWLAKGDMKVSLRSMPVLTLNRTKGALLAGDDKWHAFDNVGEWCTANVMVRGKAVTVAVNGKRVIENAPLTNPDTNGEVNRSGQVMFNADADGAVVRHVCIRKHDSK